MSGMAEQFPHAWQQRESSRLGMWIFLATEVLFFGVLFFAYSYSRFWHAADFAAASRHTDVLLGTCNTALLLTSSLTMALAVRYGELRRWTQAHRCMQFTMVLGAVFLVVKACEYYQEYREHLIPQVNFQFEAAHARGAEMFFSLYFVMTGIHALHLMVGIGVLAVVARKTGARAHAPELRGTVEVAGLYWHFIDLVWIFLYPLLYLVARA